MPMPLLNLEIIERTLHTDVIIVAHAV